MRYKKLTGAKGGGGKIAKKTKPKLWSRMKSRYGCGVKGKHSARACQQATSAYKKAGGGYRGKKKASNSLSKWTKQDWGYVGRKGSRYLPKAVRDSLTTSEKRATNRKKRLDTKMGRKYSSQPKKVRRKTRLYT
jgi:hypothetical protein